MKFDSFLNIFSSSGIYVKIKYTKTNSIKQVKNDVINTMGKSPLLDLECYNLRLSDRYIVTISDIKLTWLHYMLAVAV